MSGKSAGLKSITARANTFSLLTVVMSIVGATVFLILFQQYTKQSTKNDIDTRAQLVAFVIEEQVEFYRRIFHSLANRPELLEIVNIEDGGLATKWSTVRNRLIPDSIGIGVFSEDGNLLGKPKDHFIGRLCLQEMKMRTKGIKFPQPPIHRDIARLTHFDLISDIRHADGTRAGLLFASVSIDVLKETLGKIVRSGETIQLFDGNNQLIVQTDSEQISSSTARATLPIANTDWTFKASLNVPTPPITYYWSIAGIIIAVTMFSLLLIYYIRMSLKGLVGEMENIRIGMEAIFAGKFDGSMPKPVFTETSEVNAAIERVSKLIFTQNQNLALMSETDDLTSLYNRRRILQELKRLLARVARGAKAIVVLMDLDKFKAINDLHGHAIGDQVLIAIANALLETRRGSDLVGRLGGDEFIAILVDAGASTEVWYRRLNKAFKRNMQNVKLQENEYCTVSAGALTLGNQSLETPESILLRVDSVLYKAKKKGGSTVVTI